MNSTFKHNPIFFIGVLIIILLKNNIALAQKDSKVNIREENSEMNKTLWGFNIGYFPYINNGSFISSGMSASFTSETLYDSKFNLGCYLLLRQTFKEEFENLRSGGFSLVGTLSYFWKIKSGRIFLRTGIGLGYPGIYLTLINLFALEYQFKISENKSLSISVVEEMARFKYFLPPIMTIGIIF